MVAIGFKKIETISNYGTNLTKVSECENDLRNNYTSPGHPIAFGGINTIFNYYNGILDKEKIKEILTSIESYTLHREFHKNQRNPTYAHFKRYQFQMDLVDIQSLASDNDGASYLLTCIDIFTRKAWVRVLTSKHAKFVLEGFKSILREAVNPPKTVTFDRGSEFRNKLFKDFCDQNNIEVRTPDSSIHAAFVERFNRTLQSLLYKYMSENETNRFMNVYDKDGNHIPVLSKLMETYNNRKHRMTGFSPNEADKDDESTHLAIRLRQSKEQEKIKPRPIKFKVGDKVRISKIKGKFGRGYQPSTQLEIFRIYQIKNKSKIPMYVLESNDGNEILEGAFYDFELTKVTEDLFCIEKILKTETKKGKTRHYVKWKGFNDSYNSWIDGDNIVKKF